MDKHDEDEVLREVLLDLERARNFERELRRETEGLLAGLKILALEEPGEQTFSALLEALRQSFGYERALVLGLTQTEQAEMQVLACTDARFRQGKWRAQALFQDVLAGRPVAVFDLERVPEWQAQPSSWHECCRSALLIPLHGLSQKAILVATHSELGFFTQQHLKLASQLSLLASQALRQHELVAQWRYQQAFVNLILDAMPAMVYVKDAQNRLILSNQKAEELLEPEQWAHLGAPQLLHAEDHHQERVLEELLLNRQGQKQWFQTTLKSFMSPEQEPFILGVSTDITLRKEAEQVLEDANFQLQQAMLTAKQANDAKSRFLATISHELRTPMNAILGFAKIVLSRSGQVISGKNQLFVQRIYDNAKKLLELINELLDLSRIEAGQMDCRKETFELVPLLEEILATHDVLIEQKDLKLLCRGFDAELWLETDRDKLRQIIVNLLSNAVKFTSWGQIALSLESDEDRRPLSLSISDTGIGISEEKLESIFEPFYQVESDTRRSYGGSGLGLAITRELCELLEFELSVDSQVGQGSCFTIHFQMAGAKQELQSSAR